MSTESSDKRERSRSARSSGSYAPRSEEPKVAYPTRLPESTYDALMAAKSAVGTSGNNLVAESIDHYLASPEFRSRLERARSAQEEAIKKLSGG